MAKLLLQYKVRFDQRGFRLIGVGVSNLEAESLQIPLFEELRVEKPQDINKLLSDIQKTFAKPGAQSQMPQQS